MGPNSEDGRPRNIAQRLSSALRKAFCEDRTSGYQIGRSVTMPRLAKDYDLLLLVRGDDGRYQSQIRRFAKSLRTLGMEPTAFDTDGGALRSTVGKACELVERGNDISIQQVWKVGPHNRNNLASDVHVLHICGPLDEQDWKTFSRELPFHTEMFRRVHRKLFGPSLITWSNVKSPSPSGIVDWAKHLLRTAERKTDPFKQRKLARRSLLCGALAIGTQDVYRKTERWISGMEPLPRVSGLTLDRAVQIVRRPDVSA